MAEMSTEDLEARARELLISVYPEPWRVGGWFPPIGIKVGHRSINLPGHHAAIDVHNERPGVALATAQVAVLGRNLLPLLLAEDGAVALLRQTQRAVDRDGTGVPHEGCNCLDCTRYRKRADFLARYREALAEALGEEE